MSMNARNENAQDPSEQRPLRGGDTRLLPVVLFAAFLVAAVAGCILLSLAVLRVAIRPDQHGTAAPPESAGASPRLQVDPEEELAVMLQEKQTILKRYGWVDRSANVVRIPIARAIELAVERGLPNFAPTPLSAPPIQPQKEGGQ